MKRTNLLLALIIAGCTFSQAQNKPYNVVFDLTSGDTAAQRTVIRWITSIAKSNPSAKLEVVLYGQSLSMITRDKSIVANDVTTLTSNKNISFKVCELAMKRHNVNSDQLLSGVEVVPDGIYEIISKQQEGWGYIKVAQ